MRRETITPSAEPVTGGFRPGSRIARDPAKDPHVHEQARLPGNHSGRSYVCRAMLLDMVRTTAAAALFTSLVLVGCQRGPTTSPDDVGPDAEGVVAQAESEGEPDAMDDEGDPDDSPDEVAAADPNAEVITFDDMDANPGGTDIITVQPDRTKSGSLLTPDVLAGPK